MQILHNHLKRFLSFAPLLLVIMIVCPACTDDDNAVIITEVAWMGTNANSGHEFIELYNTTDTAINFNSAWTLESFQGNISITLTGTIPAYGYYLLERVDNAVDIPADQTYSGELEDSNDGLRLIEDQGGLAGEVVIDSAYWNDSAPSGNWPAGTTTPTCATMERLSPLSPDIPSNWQTNNGFVRNGLDANGNPINGTPKSATGKHGAGRAIVFNGTDDYVDVSDEDELDLGENGTIEAWIKVSAFQDNSGIICKGNAAGTAYILRLRGFKCG